MPRLFALLFLVASLAVAQDIAGTITGTVFDQQQAAVPGVTVTATNVDTNTSQSATSTGSGSYTIAFVKPGTYRVQADMTGFSSTAKQVEVGTSRTVTLDFVLSVGQTKTQVSVTAEAGMIQTANAAIQYSVSPRMVQELPIANDSMLRALVTLPGVVGDAGTEQSAATMGYTMPGATYSIGGGRMGSTDYKADGIENTSMYYGRIAQSFSAEAIQEVQVQENSFSAEFGRVGAGVVNYTTKSGTNELHGVVFSSIQNDAMNAAPYANTYRYKGLQRLWRGGFDVGGPVYIPKVYNGKNKSFFFANFEPLRQSTSTTWYSQVPTDLERQGNFSKSVYSNVPFQPVNIFQQFAYNASGTALTTTPIIPLPGQPYPAFAGNILPANLISPIGQKLANLLPEPNYVSPDPTNLKNYTAPMGVKNVDNRYMLKWDQAVTDSNHFSFRFSQTPTHGNRYYFGGQNSLVDMNDSDNSIGTSFTLSDTQIISGNKVNEFRVGYSRSLNSRVAPTIQNSKDWFQEFNMPSILSLGMPKYSFDDGFENPVGGTGTYEWDNVMQANDTFSWVHGRHTVKFGFEFQAPQQDLLNLNNVQGSYNFSGNSTGIGTADTATYLGLPSGAQTGSPIATLLLGFPTSVNMAQSAIPYQYRWKYYAGYIQDDFKLTPRLTLNLGARYQVEVPRSDKHNNQGNYVNAPAVNSLGQDVMGYIQLSGLGGASPTMFPTRYNNIEPRFGVAYRLEGMKWLKVLRGGYGISHTPTNGLFNSPYPDLSPNSQSLAATGGVNGGQVQLDSNPLKLPAPLAPWPSSGKYADLTNVATLAYLNQDVTIPYIQEWNFGLGFEFGNDLGMEVTYVGSKGTNLFGPPTETNTENLAAYEAAYRAGYNMGDQLPNPFGLTNAAGKVITVSRDALFRANPLLGGIVSPLTQGGNSSYNSMQLQLVKRYSQGIQFNFNYSFSKSLDNSSCEGQFCGTNMGNWSTTLPQLSDGPRNLERSVSTFDITHVFHFSFVGELPFGRNKKFLSGANRILNTVVGNWKVSGLVTELSGKPWIAFLGSNAGLPDDVGQVRANWAPGVTGCIENPGWRQWLNVPSHQYSQYLMAGEMFTPPAQFTTGNVPRTLSNCRMPWTNTFDAALTKEFPIHEQVKVVLRAEAYQVLNNPNFIGNVNSNNVFQNLNYTNYVNPPVNTTPGANIQTSFSNMTSNIGPQRTMQVSLKVYF